MRNEIKRRVICLVLSLIITLSTCLVVFQTDIKTYAAEPKEYSDIISLGVSSLLPNSTDLKYVHQTMEGQNIDIYTFVEGKFTPVNIQTFLAMHLLRNDDGKLMTFKQISSKSVEIYVMQSLDGEQYIQLDLSGTSMRPLVLQREDGKIIAIRFSKKFLEKNDIKNTDKDGIFETDYNYEEDPKLEKQIKSFVFENMRDNTLAVIKPNQDIRVGTVEVIGEELGINTNKDVFNTNNGVIIGSTDSSSDGSFNFRTTERKSSGVPEYKTDTESSNEADNKTVDKKEDIGELDQYLGKQPGEGNTLFEALLAQKDRASKYGKTKNQVEEGTTSLDGSSNTGNNTGKTTGSDNNTDMNENNGCVDCGTDIQLDENGYAKQPINTLSILDKYKKAIPKKYGAKLTDSFLDSLPLSEIESLLSDAIKYEWPNRSQLEKAYKKAYSSKIDSYNIGNTKIKSKSGANSSDYTRTNYWKPTNPVDNSQDSGDYFYQNGVRTRKDVIQKGDNYRFKWGRMDKNNLNGYTNENKLLLKGVYKDWDVNLLDTSMNKIDIKNIKQVQSETLVPVPITFEPLEQDNSILLKLAVFGLVMTASFVIVFAISKKINIERNNEEFKRKILLTEEKLNLSDFDSDKFNMTF